jgi:hypothetical protein
MASTAKKTTAAPASADDLGQAEVQARFDEAEAKGYWGSVPDETPNEAYTLAGVTAGKPTPENQRGK